MGREFPDAEPKGVREIFEEMRNGKIKAAIVVADGLNHTARQLGDVQAALGALETLVVSSVFDNELTAKADIVFPAAPFSEQTSTVTNLEVTGPTRPSGKRTSIRRDRRLGILRRSGESDRGIRFRLRLGK